MGVSKEEHRSLSDCKVLLARLHARDAQNYQEWVRPALKPLFRFKEWNNDSPLVFEGTGVLFSLNDYVFILTAAHVLEPFDTYVLRMPIGSDIVPIKGESYRSKRPQSGTHDDDPIDAAVFKIEDPEIRKALRPDCLTIDDIWMMADEVSNLNLSVTGYRAKTFKRKGRSLDCKLFTMHLPASPSEAYVHTGMKTEDHILMKYSKRMYGPRGASLAQSPRGMSGGGVWMVPELCGAEWPPKLGPKAPRLVGIFIERQSWLGVYVATKIIRHLQLISGTHPGILSEIFREAINESLVEQLKKDALDEPLVVPKFTLSEMESGQDLVIRGEAPFWTAFYRPSYFVFSIHRERSPTGTWTYRFGMGKYTKPVEPLSHSEMMQVVNKAIWMVELSAGILPSKALTHTNW